ncbi:hypothetical protein FDECE_3392 [Fusarium decemcellulare]|nr:hypothetical protein FDECE_3392 [Fusarium decemcellulare]
MAAPASDDPMRRPSTAGAGSEPEIIETHEEETPTVSHALAEDSKNFEEKGASQIEHGDIEVKNLGWNKEPHQVPNLVGGLKNEDLWTLVRRFDKQVFYVRSIEEPPLGELDMNIADDEEFSPEKLRAQIERLYMSVFVQLFSFYKHVVRLRSWKEYQRTSAFLAVYTLAWLLDLLGPTIIVFLMILISSTQAREICFPGAPPSLIDPKTGGVQTPAAGVLASDDSVTGAPENHKGEAVEQEAHSFVTSLSTIVVSTAAGKHPQTDPDEDSAAPDPTQLTEDVTDAKQKTVGNETGHEHNRAKKPVSNAVWDKARPTMHLIADFVDTWERFGNALSPAAPFHRHRPKIILVAALFPMLLGSWFMSPYLVMKGAGFGAGFGFFGDPIITPALDFINRTYPRWEKYVELRNTILRGVPTNAQLAITLLRIGERNKAPLPPPPSSNQPPSVEPHETAGEGLDHLGVYPPYLYSVNSWLTPTEGATEGEIAEAVQPDPDVIHEEEREQEEEKTKHKKSHRIMNFIRASTKGGVATALAADKAKAKAGAHHAKNRLGVVKGGAPNPLTGPIRFPARYKGKKGHAYITATATTPAVSWTSDIGDVKPAWTVTIGEIDELKKMGGLGWKSKIIVGWAMGSEIVDGLMVRTKDGKEHHLTAVIMRDQLFNRLISMGHQMWEAWRDVSEELMIPAPLSNSIAYQHPIAFVILVRLSTLQSPSSEAHASQGCQAEVGRALLIQLGSGGGVEDHDSSAERERVASGIDWFQVSETNKVFSEPGYPGLFLAPASTAAASIMMGGFATETFDAVTAATWLVCETCGTQFPTADRTKVKTCHICDDPRQFVPPSGQSFSTLEELRKTHTNEFTPLASDPRFTFIQSTPKLAIGQRAILIKTPEGNILWDCISLLDDETVARIEALGGLKAIVISHPHFYSTHVQWARAFRCPVYLASEDKRWATMESTHQVFLSSTETEIARGVKAIKLGGHFPGSMVLLFDGRLLIADTLMTTASGVGAWDVDATGAARDRPPGLNSFSFLYSIPNFIPLSVDEMARMWGILRGYEFRATHGGFAGMDIEDENLKKRVLDSMQIQARHMGYGDSEFMKETL